MKGIDISKHNGVINFTKLKGVIDFVMIRAGYGKNNIDTKLTANVEGVKKVGLHFGFYWFSYAKSESMAVNEANYLCDIADKYHPDFPLVYDWEYESDKNYAKSGKPLTNSERVKFAKAFLNQVEKRGYYAMIYANADYIKNKGFNQLLKTYDLWLAQPSGKTPAYSCGIWQYSFKGKLTGINTDVDLDIAYKDYHNSLLLNKKENKEKNTMNINEKIVKRLNDVYVTTAKEIINGKYGNGEERKEKIKSIGLDYDIVQMIVSELM